MPDKYPDPPLTKSKWLPEELDGQVVEFLLTYADGSVSSTGKFVIGRREGELMTIEIEWTEVIWDKLTGRYQLYPLLQQHVDRIELHPEANQENSTKPKFRVVA